MIHLWCDGFEDDFLFQCWKVLSRVWIWCILLYFSSYFLWFAVFLGCACLHHSPLLLQVPAHVAGGKNPPRNKCAAPLYSEHCCTPRPAAKSTSAVRLVPFDTTVHLSVNFKYCAQTSCLLVDIDPPCQRGSAARGFLDVWTRPPSVNSTDGWTLLAENPQYFYPEQIHSVLTNQITRWGSSARSHVEAAGWSLFHGRWTAEISKLSFAGVLDVLISDHSQDPDNV